jgi:RNA polymerase subunit RPABC4/transcription elongation factor Spt4
MRVARKALGFVCKKCSRFIVWSNFGVCPYCRAKTNP